MNRKAECRVAVTGSAGLLGGTLVRQFRDAGLQVVAHVHRHAITLDGVHVIRGDLRHDDPVLIEAIERSDWMVHAAAATNVDWCEDHPAETYALNADMPERLARLCRRSDTRMIYISTDAVYDGEKNVPHTEDDPVHPITVYAEAKYQGELNVLHECPNAVVIRTNIYGWNVRNKKSLAEWMLDKLLRHEYLPGFHDVVFSPVLTNHLSDILLRIMKRRRQGIFNVGACDHCSKYAFAVQLAEHFDLDASVIRPVRAADVHLKARRPRFLGLNVEKVEQALDMSMPSIGAGIALFRKLEEEGYVMSLKAMQENASCQHP